MFQLNITSFLQSFLKENKQAIIKVYLSAVVLMFIASVYVDITTSQPVLGDLRNRQVGARMMKDGLSPYFYIWKAGDSIRYYDMGIPSANVSRATATPFFHHVFEIVADLPQFKMDRLWLFIEYLTLFGTCLFAIFLIPQTRKKTASLVIIGLAVAFTYTVGWRVHVFIGQNYIFIPFLLMGCFYFFKQRSTLLNLFLFAVFAISLILIRPLAVLFFLPFLFFFHNYFKWFLVSACLIIAYSLFAFFNPIEKNNWKDYFKSLPIHVANHQYYPKNTSAQNKAIINNVFKYRNTPPYEGVDFESGADKVKMAEMGYKSECSNLFIFYNKITGKHLSINAMTLIGAIVCLLVLLPLFLLIYKKQIVSTESLLLLGFMIYNIFSFCMPIIRAQYNWVEFLFPFLLLPIYIKEILIVPFVFLLLGLYFNIAELPYIKMRHNIGEFMILVSLLFLVYRIQLMAYLPEKKWKINDGLYWL